MVSPPSGMVCLLRYLSAWYTHVKVASIRTPLRLRALVLRLEVSAYLYAETLELIVIAYTLGFHDRDVLNIGAVSAY